HAPRAERDPVALRTEHKALRAPARRDALDRPARGDLEDLKDSGGVDEADLRVRGMEVEGDVPDARAVERRRCPLPVPDREGARPVAVLDREVAAIGAEAEDAGTLAARGGGGEVSRR